MKSQRYVVLVLILALTASCGTSATSGDAGAAGTGGHSNGSAGAGGIGAAGAKGASGDGGSIGSAGSSGSSGGGGATGSAGTSGSGGSSNGGATGHAGSTGQAGADGGASGADGGAGAVGSNGNMVMGSATGTPFAAIGSVFLIGNPDVAASTVVYIFSKTIKCADISQAGWDATIADKTQILELKMMGTAPATYQPIIKAPRFPAAGEAQVNYALSAQTGTVAESFSTAGSVTLSKIVAKASANGSFDLMFGTNALKGTYAATYCDVGREP
ncbi:MAG: hypothetical protein JWM82_4212 [Myxococcales bacterium]|nr:hypothetical protein [Myxococcales bacterium]